QLVLQDRADEPFVEEPGRAVDDVQRLRVGIVRADAAGGAERRPGGYGRPASRAGLGVAGAPADEVGHRHRKDRISGWEVFRGPLRPAPPGTSPAGGEEIAPLLAILRRRLGRSSPTR